jgi:putative membrane-bound dehydrogenase-like protein
MTHRNTFLARNFVLIIAVLVMPLAVAAPRVLLVSDAAGFRSDFTAALENAGVRVTAAAEPDAENLGSVDAVLLQRSEFALLPAASQAALTAFCEGGGGIVAVNAAVAAGDVKWGKNLLGGAWDPQTSQKFHSLMSLYVRPDPQPVTEGASPFDVTDDTIYDLQLDEGIEVLASAFTPKVRGKRGEDDRKKYPGVRASIYDIQPQIWLYQAERHRAAVFLQGAPETLKHTSERIFILRALAWVLKRENQDEFCKTEDLASLRYPAAGPLAPAEAIKQFQMQPGFEASVVAAEPLITKPIAIQWDSRGRMWVAETPEYPNGRRAFTDEAWKDTGSVEPGNYERPGRDSISILEDSDGDGLMDKKTIFKDDLELVTAFCMHGDGIIVVTYPTIFWMRDTDGDGKVDKEISLFDGVGFPDHFIINHLVSSPDGWIYASNGGRFNPRKPGSREPLKSLSPGVFRFKADGSAIEQVASVGGNSFGLDITSDLEVYFGMATTGDPIMHVVLPEWVLAQAPTAEARSSYPVNPRRPILREDLPDRAPLMQIGGIGQFSAACSSLVYEGGAWPEPYDGTVFVTEPILDIVHAERLKAQGPTYTGQLLVDDAEWLRSMDYWFCPIDVTVGPDGAMYVLDFYTPVVAHNDTRGPAHGKAGASIRPDREHYFGRIYRIHHKQASILPQVNLGGATPVELVEAFHHPNRLVRFEAHRLLMEQPAAAFANALPGLQRMAKESAFAPARILALWALHRHADLSRDVLGAALTADSAVVRKNALLIAESGKIQLTPSEVEALLDDPDLRVRLTTLRAICAAAASKEISLLLLAKQETMEDGWSRTALSAALAGDPFPALVALLKTANSGAKSMAIGRSLAMALRERGESAEIMGALEASARSVNPRLAAVVIRELSLPEALPQEDNLAARKLLQDLLGSSDRIRATAGLPLLAAWDSGRDLRTQTEDLADEALKMVKSGELPLEVRIGILKSLLGARRYLPEVLPASLELLKSAESRELQSSLIEVFAGTGELPVGSALAEQMARWDERERESAFRTIISRPEWSTQVLDRLAAGKLSPKDLGPSRIDRLTRHPDRAVAERARSVFALVGGGTSPEKDAIISRLVPLMGQAGNPAKGQVLFKASCASCHRLEGDGYLFGPDLDGIGAQTAAELLVSIVDPSRVVDDEHRTWNITMKDGTRYAALIGSENEHNLTLRLPGGVSFDVKVEELVKREKEERSLMPEGLETLGDEALRDIIAYIRHAAVGSKGRAAARASSATGRSRAVAAVPDTGGNYRPLDLNAVFTADTRKGLYAAQTALSDTLPFLKFGRQKVNGVPFELVNPAANRRGNNVIVLKGGTKESFSRTLPQRVEIPVGSPVTNLHFLGGVAGWGGGSGPAMEIEIHYTDGKSESVSLFAGREFTNYSTSGEVPNSKIAEGLLSANQVRTFVIPIARLESVEKIVLESPDSMIAPTTVAITVEVAGKGNSQAGPPPARAVRSASPYSAAVVGAGGRALKPNTTEPVGQGFVEPKADGIQRVLLVGAGGSHDFPKYFLGVDSETIKVAGGFDVAATPNLGEALKMLPQADILVLSANHGQFGKDSFQSALNDFASSGKGVVILHASTWRNWPEKTGYNERFVGGGAKGHGHGEFAVTNRSADHPIMKGVPKEFLIKDESYHALLDPAAVEVLAENAPDSATKKVYPSVWTVRHPKTKVACISLGHAQEAHANPAFQKILVNAVRWVSPSDSSATH